MHDWECRYTSPHQWTAKQQGRKWVEGLTWEGGLEEHRPGREVTGSGSRQMLHPGRGQGIWRPEWIQRKLKNCDLQVWDWREIMIWMKLWESWNSRVRPESPRRLRGFSTPGPSEMPSHATPGPTVPALAPLFFLIKLYSSTISCFWNLAKWIKLICWTNLW